MAATREQVERTISIADHWRQVAVSQKPAEVGKMAFADTARRMARNSYAYALYLARHGSPINGGFFRRVYLSRRVFELSLSGSKLRTSEFEAVHEEPTLLRLLSAQARKHS